MGPRDCSRGNLGYRHRAPPGFSSFNGAARLLARKSIRTSPFCGKMAGFNGAARLLARKCDQMAKYKILEIMLQWGRAIARAEMEWARSWL